MKNILLIEDDFIFSRLLKNFLDKNGYKVAALQNAKEAYKRISTEKFDLIMVDFRLPDDTGINVLKWIKTNIPDTHVILMTSYSDVRTAIHSIKLGALDYIVKPINPDELLISLNETFKNISDDEKSVQKKENQKSEYIKGISSSAQSMFEQIILVAPTDMSVILNGESGTGKEYAAQLIHSLSNRKNHPFVAVDCGTLSKELSASELFGHIRGAFTGATIDKTGQFEFAAGGTLFLDEIGNLSYEVQIQLLRAIQERVIRKVGDNKDIKIDVRIIAATNEDLKLLTEKSMFREDLYHRLNEFKIQIPSLRDRKEDIPFFAQHFLEKSNKELDKDIKGFSEEVMNIFYNYLWPGNLREFRNIIKRSILLSKEEFVQKNSIPEELFEFSTITENIFDLKESKRETEKEKIITALEKCKYNKTKAAKILNIDRKTLYSKIEKYNIVC